MVFAFQRGSVRGSPTECHKQRKRLLPLVPRLFAREPVAFLDSSARSCFLALVYAPVIITSVSSAAGVVVPHKKACESVENEAWKPQGTEGGWPRSGQGAAHQAVIGLVLMRNRRILTSIDG